MVAKRCWVTRNCCGAVTESDELDERELEGLVRQQVENFDFLAQWSALTITAEGKPVSLLSLLFEGPGSGVSKALRGWTNVDFIPFSGPLFSGLSNRSLPMSVVY